MISSHRAVAGRALLLVVAASGWLLHAPARAEVVEEVIAAPVSLKTASGEVQQDIVVTLFHDDKRSAAPYLVLNHGRAPDADKRAAMGRQRYTTISRYFVSLGFTVLVPTRIGYGETSGPDLENAGTCRNPDYAPVFAAAADQVEAVLRRARGLQSVDLSRGIVVGASFGGMTAIALSTRKLPGLVAAVNFSGGTGGNPKIRPEQPCVPSRLTELYRSWGAVAKVPSLWLYSPNDLFWGPSLPREWFDSFVGAGGKAQFVQLPPFGEDGHAIFTRNQAAWSAPFERFLSQTGAIDAAAQAGR